MKRLILALAIILGWASAAWAVPPGTLTSLHAVAALTNAEAAKQPPVAFEATVTYYNNDTRVLCVQELGEAIFVRTRTNSNLLPGDRILVEGTAQPSYLPYIQGGKVTLLRHGKLPKPTPASFDDLFTAKINCRLVTVRGVIRAADLVQRPAFPPGSIELLMDGGYILLEVDSRDEAAMKDLLDAEVEVTGSAGRTFDGKMQQVGTKIRVGPLANIKVLKRAGASPWSLPLTPMDEILTGAHRLDLSRRLRVHGTITYYEPGLAAVLQNGARSLWIFTQASVPLHIGDVADAIGFSDTHDGLLFLTHAEIRDSGVQEPIKPQLSTWSQLAFWGRVILGGHEYDLVSIEGLVVSEVREASEDEYVLSAEGRLFTAIYRHPSPPNPIPPMLQLPLGSTIRVTGICMAVDTNPYNQEAPFNIRLRSYDDIAVIAGPPLLSMSNLYILVGLLSLIVIAVVAVSWLLERKVRQKTAALAVRIEAESVLEKRAAQLEQQRSRILEDINGSRPLAEILEEITALVSLQLKDAPCWCQITDGARLGAHPLKTEHLRIVHEEIPARNGPPLGVIFAALDPLAPPASEESEALLMSARLATLAIETRRLYSDLLHRSEFDQLTDINNRFSLEKHLDAQINEARFRASIFGLIYIDLDKFKQVNDVYGHHIGDLYLQEVALRMKRQLRPHDTLARLGGDEFAALVPVVRSRAEVEEIAQRLERSFDEPFAIQRLNLRGTASIGLALYPEDGASRDSLLNAADVAMYTAKNAKRQR
jgi:diguanylate cyclase (GGDEF)-like protein